MTVFAFVFESVGSGEWLVLLAVVLIIVGPRNLPAAARKMGQVMSKLRRAADEFKRQLMTMDEEMKRAAEGIKNEYIDIPADTPGGEIVSGDGADGGSGDKPSDDPEDYMGGYHEEDYYGADEDYTGDYGADPSASGQPGAETVNAASGSGGTDDGKDSRDTEKS